MAELEAQLRAAAALEKAAEHKDSKPTDVLAALLPHEVKLAADPSPAPIVLAAQPKAVSSPTPIAFDASKPVPGMAPSKDLQHGRAGDILLSLEKAELVPSPAPVAAKLVAARVS